MPYLATSARGVINIMLEANSGEQLLLATTAVIPTITGLSAPSGSTGMRLHIRVVAWSASGSLTITGTGSPANTETVSVAAMTAQQTQSAQMATYDYVSVNAYSALTNITTTGMTGGFITVWGIPAGKFQLPGTMKSKRTPKTYSPNEHNGLIERDKKVLQLVNNTTVDEVKQDAYGDLSLWWCYMAMGAPSATATYPASPASLFTATPISSSMTLTTQPTTPGMKLILTITSFTVAGTLTVTGTVNGIAGVTEQISIPAAGTYYSSNAYSAVSGITNVTTAATLAVTGVFGWQYTFGSGASLYSAAIEWFDGTGSWTHPFSFATDADFDSKVDAECTLTVKGKAADKLPIGDRTTSPLVGINRIVSIGANLNDLPMVGWQSMVYLDAITGTPATTSYADMQECKIALKLSPEEHFTYTNQQNFNRVYAGKRECTVDVTLDFTNMLQWEQFRQNLKQYFVYQLLGQLIGSNGGAPLYKSWTWTLPMRNDGDFEPTSDPSKAIVTAKAKFRCEYDASLGSAYRLVVISQVPPNYTA
jgi:hypothetical protein